MLKILVKGSDVWITVGRIGIIPMHSFMNVLCVLFGKWFILWFKVIIFGVLLFSFILFVCWYFNGIKEI